MSHFTVLVIGDDVEKQLAPYQENNMGDCPEEFLEFRDVEEECRKDYEEDTTQDWYPDHYLDLTEDQEQKLVSGDQVLISASDPILDSKSGKKYKSRKAQIYFESLGPETKALVKKGEVAFLAKKIEPPKEFPVKEKYSFTEYVEEYCGYKKDPKTRRYGYWENPNRKWDWYQIGGRWNGFFKLKPALLLAGPEGSVQRLASILGFTKNEMETLISLYKENHGKFDQVVKKYKGNEKTLREHIALFVANENITAESPAYRQGVLGTPGVFGPSRENLSGRADQALKGDIDFDAMRDEAAKNAVELYEKVLNVFDGKIPRLELIWKEVLDGEKYKDLNIDQKRELFHNQPAMKRVAEVRKKYLNMEIHTKKNPYDFLYFLNIEDYQISQEEYVQRARDNALGTFAVVKDGKWYERGEMGWWACVSNEKDGNKWQEEFNKLLDEADNNTLLTVVDCHI